MPRRPADKIRQALPELLEARTEFSKLYRRSPNKFRLIHTTKKVHYFDTGTSQLEEIDLEWRMQQSEARIWAADYRCQVALNRIAFRFQDTIGVEFVSELRQIDGKNINTLPLNIAPIIQGEKLYFPDVLPDLDIYLIAKPTGVEWYKVIKGPLAPKEFTWRATEDPQAMYTINNNVMGWDTRGHRMDITVVESAKTVIAGGLERYTITETFNNRVWTRKNPTRQRVNFAFGDLAYPLNWDINETVTVTVDADDVYSYGGSISNGWQNQLLAGAISWADPEPLLAGLRFLSVDVPTGTSNIDASSITVNVTLVSNTPDTTLFGDSVGDAPAWSSTAEEPRDINQTTASVDADPSGTGTHVMTTTAIVQEIVALGGWSANNDMRFAIVPATGVGINNWYFTDSTHATLPAPVLSIDYTAAGAVGTADFNLPVPTITGIGDIAIAGLASFNLPVPTITGIGTRGDGTGVADFNLPVPTITGIGTRGDGTGVADFNLPVLTITGIGDIAIAGLASFNMPVLTITGIGTRGAGTGVADFPLPVLTITGAGTVASGGAITGTADFNLPVLTITGIGDIPIAGIASFNLPVPTITGIGTRGDGTGVADFNLPVLTITGIGDIPVFGTANFTLPALGITGIGVIPIAGLSGFNLPALGLTGIGNLPIAGLADFNLPVLTLTGIGTRGDGTGIADFNIPVLTITGAGVVGAFSPIIGTADFNLPSLWVLTQGRLDINMVNIFSVTGQTGTITGTAVALERKAGAFLVNRDVLAQILLGAGSATINIEASLDGGTSFTNLIAATTTSQVSSFLLPPIIRVRLSAATGATVNVWLDADLVITRINN